MINSSFPKVADQIIEYNRNVIEILSKINSMMVTTDTSINVSVYDSDGKLRNFTLPSFTTLKSEIDRLNNNINSLYAIDSGSALIQTSNTNKWKKIISIDLNREPSSIDTLGSISTFVSKPNWLFDNMMDPMVSVEFNLSGKIEDNVRKTLVRRYIIDFQKDVDGNITSAGQNALTSFNDLFNGNVNIILDEFETWLKTTNGVINGSNPKIDETVFDLEPNSLLYDGSFSVLRTQEDRINRKLWYVFDKLDYLNIIDNKVVQLKVGDEVIPNTDRTSTRYKVIEISTSEASPRVRFERVEGIEAIFIGINALKIYSPVIFTKNLRVSVGYNERNVIFLKPINTENNIVSRKWSGGTGFYSNDLKLVSDTTTNGLSMEQYYIDYIYDYGEVLKDMVAKKTPNKNGGIPSAPLVNIDNFKVVQINKHLTDTPDSKLIKQKHNYQTSLKSEIQQLSDAIISRNKTAKFTKYKSESVRKQAQLEIEELSRKKDSRSKLLATTTQEIIDLSRNPKTKTAPKFALRGFWNIPSPILVSGSKPQEIIQFKIEYRYVSKDGNETPVITYNIDDTKKGAFSNWISYKTDVRKRSYNSETGEYTWEIENTESAETPNINQLDLAIQVNEKIEFRIKSISEVGYPESPIESDWSTIYEYVFPDDLSNVVNDSDFILASATKEELKITLNNDLAAKGLDEHLSDTITANNKTFHHESNKIVSGFKDENGVSLDLFQYLSNLEIRIKSLEEKIKRAKGELEIVILRNNKEFVVKNDSETVFNIECEDYLDIWEGGESPSGRVYANNTYVIKDFVIKIRNTAIESSLGLLTNRTYLKNNNVYDTNMPQTFWVNNQDELLINNIDGRTYTQIDNQWLWMVNYDLVGSSNVFKLSENIGNNRTTSNSLTNVLSSTEYNIGYNEQSELNFLNGNNSLLDTLKWKDDNSTVSSSNKFLTTIHPVVKELSVLQDKSGVKIIEPGDKNAIIIPINIYFKLNSLDTKQKGSNYQWVDLNSSTKSIKHIKKLKLYLENEVDNRPFIFTLKFNINRNKVVVKKYGANTGGLA